MQLSFMSKILQNWPRKSRNNSPVPRSEGLDESQTFVQSVRTLDDSVTLILKSFRLDFREKDVEQLKVQKGHYVCRVHGWASVKIDFSDYCFCKKKGLSKDGKWISTSL
jgi:hypothetical protein